MDGCPNLAFATRVLNYCSGPVQKAADVNVLTDRNYLLAGCDIACPSPREKNANAITEEFVAENGLSQ